MTTTSCLENILNRIVNILICEDFFLVLYQVSGLSQRVAELEGQLDRTHRDKSSLTNQLEDTLRKLTSQEQDNTKVRCVLCGRKP